MKINLRPLTTIRTAILFFLTFWIVCSVLIPDSVLFHNLPRALEEPTRGHPFGYDAFGRDLLLLSVKSSFTSFLFSISCVAGAVLLSLALAPYCILESNIVTRSIIRFNGLLLSLPGIVMGLVLASFLGASALSIIVSILIGTVPITFRLMTLRSRDLLIEDFIKASLALGSTTLALIHRHFIPALWETCRVKIPNLIAGGILAEAAISFLGAGAPAGTDTWGSLLAQGRSYMLEAPHIMIGTGLPLVAVLLCLNYIYKS